MNILKLFFIMLMFSLSALQADAQGIITGPKKVVKTQKSNVNKTEEHKTPRVSHEIKRRTDHSRTGKISHNNYSRISKVDYSRYNDGLVEAAENGDVKACHCLGHLYDKDYGYNGVLPDEEKAIRWYTFAADKGDYCAQIDLVFHCLNWPTTSAALETVLKYAEMGNVYMQSSLAAYYINKFKYSDAITWLRLAANNENAQDESYNEQGFPAQVEAWYMLGKCYCEGLGVNKDSSMGKMWMNKAAKAGLSEASTYLEEH